MEFVFGREKGWFISLMEVSIVHNEVLLDT